MKHPAVVLIAGALVLFASQVQAWGNHTIPTYRALEQMPELVKAAPVKVETLDSFLKTQEKAVEALLRSQEDWAIANIENYPRRPDALRFTANAQRGDEARRLAFLMALRVAPDSRFALYYQPDPAKVLPAGAVPMSFAQVNTLPEPVKHNYRFLALRPGDLVAPLVVVASAADEPDYGLDINCWSDSPSDWGKVYNFGKLPFGNPALPYSTQAPFHMGFFHESDVLYKAAPFIKRTYPLLRSYQFWSLAALAFRSGHPYWGWRFAGISLHYLQDLSQPYHARLAPGVSTAKLLSDSILAMAGVSGFKDDTIVLLSNRHLVVDKYQNALTFAGSFDPKVDSLERALADSSRDATYPAWSDRYVRDVVTRQSFEQAQRLSEIVAVSLPPRLVNDPGFDLGAQGNAIDLVKVVSEGDPQAKVRLDHAISELLANFGAHTRNEIRSILQASGRP